MSSKTKIVVIRKKELLFTGIIVLAAITLLVLLLRLFGSQEPPKPESAETMKYKPGVYTSTVILNDTAMDVEVIVDENNINSISLVNLSETVETMYPLVRPAMEELSEQIIASQSADGVQYPQSNQYTSMVLHNAIKAALEKALL